MKTRIYINNFISTTGNSFHLSLVYTSNFYVTIFVQMAWQIFVNCLKFRVPVMTLGSSDTHRQGNPTKNMVLASIFATFCVTSRLHEQFFVCDNFYLS